MRRFNIALLAVLSALVAAAPAAAAPSYRIAFARQVATGGADVFTVRPDGSGERQVPLVYPAEDFGVPRWSPDRRELLITHTLRFDGAGGLLPFRPAIVDLDGSHFRLLPAPGSPSSMDCGGGFYQDAGRLLCSWDEGTPGVVSVRSSDGGDPHRLTTYPFGPCNACDESTDISPDGRQFVFVRFEGEDTYNEQVALFVANIDGTDPHQITPYGLAQPHEIAAARWSPDGSEIISETTDGRLFMVHPNGRGLHQIDLRVGTSDYYAFEPSFSPDGSRIVFCMFINGQEDVYTANRGGAQVVQLTNTPDFENGPDWGRLPVPHEP